MKRRKGLKFLPVLSVAALILITGLSIASVEAGEKTYPNAHLLVEADWVADHLDDPGVRLVDVRPASEYAQGHIENAVNIDVKATLTTTVNGVRGMVVPKEKAEEVLGRAGIGRETHVVAYDASGGLWAARLFWILDYYGHEKVSLLNGGLVKWLAEGRELTSEVPTVKETLFTAQLHPEKLATMDWIKGRLDDDGTVILDARSHEEYVGEKVRSARGGHIPGAAHLNWIMTITDEQKTFLLYKELRNLIFRAGAKRHNEVVTYCQTGVRGAQLYFVLKLLGYQNVRLYDGSWQEWGNAESTPIDKKEASHETC